MLHKYSRQVKKKVRGFGTNCCTACPADCMCGILVGGAETAGKEERPACSPGYHRRPKITPPHSRLFVADPATLLRPAPGGSPSQHPAQNSMLPLHLRPRLLCLWIVGKSTVYSVGNAGVHLAPQPLHRPASTGSRPAAPWIQTPCGPPLGCYL
jgi:hypothetical protein